MSTSIPVIPDNILDLLAAQVTVTCWHHGLLVGGLPFRGEVMQLPDLRVVALDMEPEADGTRYWRDVQPVAGETYGWSILRVAGEMIDQIAARHGPGTVWTHEGTTLVHIVTHDGRLLGPSGTVRLRKLYAHEASAKAPGPTAHDFYAHRLDVCSCGHRRGDHEGAEPCPCMQNGECTCAVFVLAESHDERGPMPRRARLAAVAPVSAAPAEALAPKDPTTPSGGESPCQCPTCAAWAEWVAEGTDA